ncbi:MAG: double zinc ribbon domain-containing protein [Desulfurispora sp.]|uniref:double zinc ribbon domain-containing protein n=1 Tax=Desulfurispora sp. TaxID=3014275 RepID=UPI00404A09A8
MKMLWQGLLELLYPPPRRCPLCGEPGRADELCPQCAGRLAVWRQWPRCARCGRFFLSAAVSPAGLCLDCRQLDARLIPCRAVAPYEGVVQQAVHQLKYAGQTWLVEILGELMARCWQEDPLGPVDALVPVPLSRKRLGERGYNQALLLARAAAGHLGLPVWPALHKVRETPSQTALGRAERQRNLQGAFSPAAGLGLAGRSLLLVDDVLTTGSTLVEAAAVLQGAGAVRVYGLVFASGVVG